MKSRKNTEAVVSAMGALLGIAVDLVDYIQELKGEVGECIYRLARPEGKETLKAVADLIVTDWLKWKIDNELIPAEVLSPEQAEELIGSVNFFGPKEVKRALGIDIEPKDVPQVPFSKMELERAKELNHFLILRIEKDNKGNPLTMKILMEFKNEQTQNDSGKLLCDTDWYQNESFFTTEEISQTSWALVSREVIKNTTNSSYLHQTKILIKYLIDKVYAGQSLPQAYQEAIDEFKTLKGSNTNLESAGDALEKLKITQLLRRLPVEVLYDLIVNHDGKDSGGRRLLIGTYDWSASRTSEGYFVYLGCSLTGDLKIFRYVHSGGNYFDLGACLSRNPSKH